MAQIEYMYSFMDMYNGY